MVYKYYPLDVVYFSKDFYSYSITLALYNLRIILKDIYKN